MIHCIGDSHASPFSGLGTREDTYMIPIYPQLGINNDPMFRAYRLGPATAYNLDNKLDIINDILNKHVDKEQDSVLMVFGEIDSRFHIIEQSIKQNKSREEITSQVVNKYFDTVLNIKNEGYNVIIFAPIASSFWNENSDHIKDGFKYNMEFPMLGTCQERNIITKIFTDILIQKGIETNIQIISIFDELIDADYNTKTDYYMDYLHLSSIALPLIKSKL